MLLHARRSKAAAAAAGRSVFSTQACEFELKLWLAYAPSLDERKLQLSTQQYIHIHTSYIEHAEHEQIRRTYDMTHAGDREMCDG